MAGSCNLQIYQRQQGCWVGAADAFTKQTWKEPIYVYKVLNSIVSRCSSEIPKVSFESLRFDCVLMVASLKHPVVLANRIARSTWKWHNVVIFNLDNDTTTTNTSTRPGTGSNFDIKFDGNLNDFRNRIPPSFSFQYPFKRRWHQEFPFFLSLLLSVHLVRVSRLNKSAHRNGVARNHCGLIRNCHL